MSDTPLVERIEQALVARLAAALPEIPIEAYPDDPDAYDFMHETASVLLRYDGGDFGRAASRTVQPWDMAFVASVLTRSLRGHTGSYAWVGLTRRALAGRRVEGATIELRKEGFVGVQGGVWRYDVTFALTLPHIVDPDADPEPFGAPLVRMDMDGDLGDITIEKEESA